MIEFGIVGHAADADDSLSVRASVALQCSGKIERHGADGPTGPFLGDAQIGQDHTGNGGVAKFQTVIVWHVQITGDLGCFRQCCETDKPLSDPPAEASRLGLGQPRVVQSSRRFFLGLLGQAQLGARGVLGFFFRLQSCLS